MEEYSEDRGRIEGGLEEGLEGGGIGSDSGVLCNR